jgi:hypothetical protein
MFTVELTRGQDHAVVVKTIPLNVPNLARAIEGARVLLDQAEGADGYRIRDKNRHPVASNWAAGYSYA